MQQAESRHVSPSNFTWTDGHIHPGLTNNKHTAGEESGKWVSTVTAVTYCTGLRRTARAYPHAGYVPRQTPSTLPCAYVVCTAVPERVDVRDHNAAVIADRGTGPHTWHRQTVSAMHAPPFLQPASTPQASGEGGGGPHNPQPRVASVTRPARLRDLQPRPKICSLRQHRVCSQHRRGPCQRYSSFHLPRYPSLLSPRAPSLPSAR